jgi:hypothetical protein
MKATTLVALALVLAAGQSPRELLNVARLLTNAEIAIVLAASRDALAGKTLRLRRTRCLNSKLYCGR